jgi:predicted permease
MHRWLMRLYPTSFRNEYGGEIRRVFARRRRDASGPVAVLALWLGEIGDTLVNAARVHVDIVRQDLRYTRRALGRARGFAFTAVLVTALGVGATTAVFSVADHVLVRPLPFAAPDRLVKIWESQPEYSRIDVSPANFRDWQQMTSSFAAMGAYTEGQSSNLSGAGDPVRLNGSDVTANFLPILGVAPAMGRLFSVEDDRDEAASAIVISDATWRGTFGADPRIIGRTVTIDSEPATVIGVMPSSFQFPSRTTDIWRLLRLPPDIVTDRGNQFLRVIARLKPGVSREQARNDLNTAAAQLERAYPKDNAKLGATLIELRDEVNVKSRQLLTALMAAAVCVLLIACTNLASLVIARASAREREMAVRTALGAGRERLARQLMTESLLLAAAGGALGVLVALLVVPLIVSLVPTSLPIGEAPSLDWRMLAIAGVVTVTTGIGFGVLPAFRLSRASDGLREGARAGTSRRTERVRAALVIAQVAASVVLLVSAGLLIRALWRVQQTDPGFRADGVLTLSTPLPMPKYGPQAARVTYYRAVLDGVRALPGVSAAAFTSFLPMSSMRGGIWTAYLPGETRDNDHGQHVSVRFITPQFFDAMGIPLKAGRALSERDALNTEKVAVVSESYARAHFPGEPPVGHRIFLAFFDRTIVGVVADIRVRGLERESEPQVYLPYQQQPDNTMTFYMPKDLVVRHAAAGGALAQQIRQIIAHADPQQPVSDVRSLSSVVQSDTEARGAQVRVLGAFAALACLLAAVGLNGLLAFIVSARTREIGVRLALGAEPRDVRAMIARRGTTLAGIGVIAGIGAAMLVGRSMQALLVGIGPSDPVTIVLAAGVTLLLALTASLLPAVRASRISPTEALKAD